MITVIIEGTKNIDNTLKSLEANAKGGFRVYVEDQVRDELSKVYDIEFVKPGRILKYGPKSDLYWQIPSGCLILVASWDYRLTLAMRETRKAYCLIPGRQDRFPATNLQRNVGKWKGEKYIVPILSVTEA